jgi:integrase
VGAGRPDLERFGVVARPVEGELLNTVVLSGLSELARNEVLFGIQSSIRGGRRSPVTVLRTTVQTIRESGYNSMRLLDLGVVAESSRWFIAQTLQALDRAGRSRDTERQLDVWDLTVWGHRGWISFVGATGMSRNQPARPIVQLWLRHAAQGWADEALCRLRTDSIVRKTVRGIGYWSEFLDRRPDRGTDPAALSRADITGFMQWTRDLERGGQLTPHNRVRFLAGVRQLLTEGRTQGLAEPGGPLERVPPTVAFRPGDIEDPKTLTPVDEVGDAIPDAVLAQMLTEQNLSLLSGDARRRFQIALETGRRPSEVCGLRADCLTYDLQLNVDTGVQERRPTLIFNASKVGKVRCRLPISDATADIIREQADEARRRHPNTPESELALFPTAVLNPHGSKPLDATAFGREIRTWVNALDLYEGSVLATGQLVLLRHAGQPVRFDPARVFPYAFRHTFAQRHIDAGTPAEVLKELMGHSHLDTTAGYYRIRATAKRKATDRILRLQVSVGGPLDMLAGPSDSDQTRYGIGQVAVPMGTCVEPSNVKASGRSCAFRHRCFGCRHFRTDPSFLVELHGYLDSLLHDRERLIAGIEGLEEWARQDALPADGEIAAVRRLIAACEARLDDLGDDERADVLTAIDELRRGRDAMSTTFPVQFRQRVRQSEPTVFPQPEAIEAAS